LELFLKRYNWEGKEKIKEEEKCENISITMMRSDTFRNSMCLKISSFKIKKENVCVFLVFS
jgi:hypothetical protein